jgi:hypothetical protein
MHKRIRDVFRRAVTYVTNSIIERRRPSHTTNQIPDNSESQNQEEPNMVDLATPTLSSRAIIQYERAKLVESSSPTFGDECLRFVNIALQTSQTFPLMMGTCATMSQYLRKELMKQHPSEYFQIIIGENNAFGFAVSDSNYYAEIEQKQYRILIFTTNRRKKENYSMHDANSQMVLEWKSILVEQSKK